MLRKFPWLSVAVDFFSFPCSPVKRHEMVRAADSLLSGVTRMLYIADIADALRLQASLKKVSFIVSFSMIILSASNLASP